MIRTFIETNQTIGLVAPELCNHLLMAGLPEKTSYSWKIYNNQIKVLANAFDTDDYYRDGSKHEDFVNGPVDEIPAYALHEVEKGLPFDYLFTKNFNGDYQISLNKAYEMESCTARRMPDAFARMLLKAIDKRIVDMKRLNKILTNSNA